MNCIRIVFGILAISISSIAASESSRHGEFVTVWFDKDGVATPLIVDSIFCQPGDPTCIGYEGESEGKLLYADQNLTIELEAL